MSASELLAQYGVTFQQAREFIHNNLNSPAIIYSTAAQYGITFDMLGELYADGVSGNEVKNFFAAKGFTTTSSAPIPPETATPEVPVEVDLTLKNVLNLSDEEIQAYNWDTLITDYQAALANIDWGTWNTTLESALANFDWESWATELQNYANVLANDDNWIAELANLFDNTNLETLFDDSVWQDNLDDDITTGFEDINWEDYSEYLAQFGFSVDQVSDLLTQAFGTVDWSEITAQFASFDWSNYLEQLSNINFDGYLQNLENLYSEDFSQLNNIAELIGAQTDIDYANDIA